MNTAPTPYSSQMSEVALNEWAELIGCTEMLAKVRRCRGVDDA